MKKILSWFKSGKKHKYVNGGKGVISIFLAIIMLPFLSMADILVESTRYHEATTILDDAMDSAALSTLSNYDSYLMDRFGLMAISQEIDINTTYTDYLEKNMDDLTSCSISSEDISAEYSLADNDVLLAQIQDISKFSAPTALAGDLGVSDLISALDKIKNMTSIFTAITSTGEAVDSTILLVDSVETLKEKATEYETSFNIYDSCYSTFEDSIDELKEAVKNRRIAQESVDEVQEKLDELGEEDTEKKKQLQSDLEDAQEELNERNSELITKKTLFENSRDAYAGSIGDLKEKLSTYNEQVTKVLESASSLVTKVESAATDIKAAVDADVERQNDIDEDLSQVNEWLDMENLSETKREELEQQKESLETEKKDLNAASKTTKAIGDGVSKANKSYADDVVGLLSEFNSDTVNGCISQLDALMSDVTNLKSDDITETYELNQSEFHKAISGVIASASIQALIDEEDEKASDASFWSDVKAMSAFFNSLFKTDLIYKSELNAFISDECDEYKEGEIDLILNDMSDLIGYFSNLSDGIVGMIKMLTELKNLFTYISNLFLHLGNYIVAVAMRSASIISELTEGKIDEKLYLNEYLIKCIPNRTNYNSKTNLYTGYKYSQISYATCGEAEQVAVVGGLAALVDFFKDFLDGGNDYMFCGAELEYILFGTKSEIINQSFAFFTIYILRIAIDAFPICGNLEVEAIASESALVTLGFGYGVIMAMYILVEPLIDTLLIVNGQDISLLKTVCYLTPSGLYSFLTRISSLGLSTETKNAVTTQAEDYLKVKKVSGSSGSDTSGITWKYENYMFVLLFVAGDMDTYLDRLQCLIAMEGVAHYGEGEFNINNTYTYLEASVEADYKTILSLDSLAKVNSFGISRTRMRGY